FPIITGILMAGNRINTGDFSGNAVVTIELILGCKWVQTEPREKSPATMRYQRRYASFAQPMQTHAKCPKRPFHGEHTGSTSTENAKFFQALAIFNTDAPSTHSRTSSVQVDSKEHGIRENIQSLLISGTESFLRSAIRNLDGLQTASLKLWNPGII
ncbi:MAG: hypothetical protein ACYCOX_11540, partial [Acidobacteriaceae bacterium]